MASHYLLKDICVENVSLMYELSEAFNALSLRKACILFILEQFDKLSAKPWYAIFGRIFYISILLSSVSIWSKAVWFIFLSLGLDQGDEFIWG